MERWGAKDMISAAFTGFKALPAPDGAEAISRFEKQFEGLSSVQMETLFKRLAKIHHPDVGGNADDFRAMSEAYENCSREAAFEKACR